VFVYYGVVTRQNHFIGSFDKLHLRKLVTCVASGGYWRWGNWVVSSGCRWFL